MLSMNLMPSAPTWDPVVHDPRPASEVSSPANGAVAVAEVPPGLRCQLTHAPLEDAVLAEDGYTYNRQAWQAHVQAHPHGLLSPVTHQRVLPTVMPNRHLKNIVAEWHAWHAAQPPHARSFDMEGWVEDFVTKEVMQKPVALPDGMVCDEETARLHIFNHPQHPGRSMLDQRMTFNPQQKMLRDLNVLQLSEAVLGHAPGTLSRSYVLPSIAAMLPRTAPAADPGAQPQAAPGPAPLAIQAANPARRGRGAVQVLVGALTGCVMVAPLGLAIAAETGAFDALLTTKQARNLGVYAYLATAPWAATVLLIVYCAGCLGQRRRQVRQAAGAPAGANAV